MVESGSVGIEAALEAWLAPFLDVMGRKTRRRRAKEHWHMHAEYLRPSKKAKKKLGKISWCARQSYN